LIAGGPDILNSTPFVQAPALAKACEPCQFLETCGGACAGRRRLQGALLEPDFYCPVIRGKRPACRSAWPPPAICLN